MILKVIAASAIAVGGLTLFAPTAMADTSSSGTETKAGSVTSQGEVQAQYAGTYDLYNLSDQVLTIESHWVSQTTWNGIEPVDGTKIYPGQSLHFAVNAKGTDGRDAGWVYLRVGQTKSYIVAVAKPTFQVGFRDSRVDYESLRESPLDYGDNAFQVTVGGTNRSTLTVTSTKNRTHHLTSAEGGAQLEALQKLCDTDSAAVCSFTPTAMNPALAAPKRGGSVLVNTGPTTVNRGYNWTTTTTTMSEWGVQASLSAKVLGLVETSFSSHYKEAYTSSEQVADSLTVPVLPGHAAWITYEAPVFRTTGDFTAKVGGNTWNITGVTFDIPRVDEKIIGGRLTVNQLPKDDPEVPTGATLRYVS